MNVTSADLLYKIGVLTVEKDALAEENRQLRAQLEKPTTEVGEPEQFSEQIKRAARAGGAL